MSDENGPTENRSRDPEVQREIVRMRADGASWQEIRERFGLSRQGARYAYQLGIRDRRRHDPRRDGPA